MTTHKFGEYNQFKVGSFVIDTTTATGTQAITGVGFTPTSCVFLALEGNAVGEMSTGMDDGTTPCNAYDSFNTDGPDYWHYSPSYSIQDAHDTGDYYQGKVNSFDSDGFTIGWNKISAPSGTLTVIYLAMA